MPIHPAPTKPYSSYATTEYLVTERSIHSNIVSMGIVPPTHEWPLLADTFTTLVYDATQGQNHVLVGTSQVGTAPCLQALALEARSKGAVKALAKDGFHLPYGFLTWAIDGENLVPVEELAPAVPGTPYAERHIVQTLSRPAPDLPLPDQPIPEEVHVPAHALVKGGFELAQRTLTGPLHMSPSIKVHAHTGSKLYRPMFYNATFSLYSEDATLVAPYLDHATVTIRGAMSFEASEGYRDLLSNAAEEGYRYEQFLNGPHRPLRSRSDLKELTKGDADPVLMSPSFGDGATIEFALSKETSREYYPLYTLRSLTDAPHRVLAQNLFWHRGSMFESRIRTDDDLVLENQLITRCKIHIPEGKTLTLRHCMVNQLSVTGGGVVIIERSPCYWLTSEGPVNLRKMNHFTPLVDCYGPDKRPLTLHLSGRVAGLHRKLVEVLATCREETPDREWVLRADYHAGRRVIRDMVEKLDNQEQRYRLLLSLYSDWLKDPEQGLKRKQTDSFPYFLSGMSPLQITRCFMASEQKEPTFNQELYAQMAANL